MHAEEADQEAMSLVNLWILADKLQIPRLRNYVLQTINDVSEVQETLPSHTYKQVYEGTSEGSPLRRYTIWSCGQFMSSESYKQYSKDFTAELLLDIAMFHEDVRTDEEKEYPISSYFVEVGES